MSERAPDRLEEAKREICRAVDQNRQTLVDASRAIHGKPELSFEEHHACQVLTELLRGAGLEVTTGSYGLETAFEASFGDEGPCVALVAEYDALPEIGHACGHNLIATAAAGAGIALAAMAGRPAGRIRVIGTPAEERGGGKELMARQGAFDGVDAAMMIHPAGVNLAGMPSIAIAELDVEYRGVASHASAMPERGINALDALVSAYQSIAALRQHIRQSERIHGVITNGGQAPNIVPERAAGSFYVRAANAAALEALKVRVLACFEAGAQATGADLSVAWGEVDYLPLRYNDPLAASFQRNAEQLGRKFIPMDLLPPSVAGSTDMGNVSHRVPSIHPMIAAAPPHCSIHNAEFATWAGSEMGDAAALDGAKALAMTALDFLFDPDLRAASKSAFQEKEGTA